MVVLLSSFSSLLLGALGGFCLSIFWGSCHGSLKFYLYGYSEATEQTMRMIIAGLDDPRAKLEYDTEDMGWSVSFDSLVFPGGINQFSASVITSGTIGGGGRCSLKTHRRAVKHYKDFLKNQFDQAQKDIVIPDQDDDKVVPLRRK